MSKYLITDDVVCGILTDIAKAMRTNSVIEVMLDDTFDMLCTMSGRDTAEFYKLLKELEEPKENKPKKMSREDYAKEKGFDKWGSMQEQSYADYLFSEAKDV